MLQQISLQGFVFVGGKTRNTAIQLALQQCCTSSCTFFVTCITVLLGYYWVYAKRSQKEEDGKTVVWQTWQGYYVHVLSWSSLNINVFVVFYKKICLKEDEVWGNLFFKQNCHAQLSHKFCRLITLPSYWVSSLFSNPCQCKISLSQAPSKHPGQRSWRVCADTFPCPQT